jgi:thioester reductase-like protein
MDARRRVHPVRGDATEPRFALPPAAYATLEAHITHVVHAAGAVRMNLPLAQARRSAIDSAERVLELARSLHRRGRLRKVDLVSTVGVGGRMSTVPEDWIDTPRAFHNTYEQAKAEAEDLARTAVREGLPVTVHRPSMVVGDSRSGRIVHYQVFYHLCEFLAGRRTRGLFPPLGGQTLDIVPSDYVARVIAASSRRIDWIGQVVHECVGRENALPLVELRRIVRERLAQRGEQLPPTVTLPAWAFTRALQLASTFLDERSRRAVSTLPVFLDYLVSDQAFENARTRQLLAQGGETLALPRWQDYLPRVLDAYLDARRG